MAGELSTSWLMRYGMGGIIEIQLIVLYCITFMGDLQAAWRYKDSATLGRLEARKAFFCQFLHATPIGVIV